MSVRYHVEHETRYEYESTVAMSHHAAFLRPRELPAQHVCSHEIHIVPAPDGCVRRIDYFGNAADHFQIVTPHTELTVLSRATVELHGGPGPLDPAGSEAWDVTRTVLAQAGAVPPDVAQFAFASPYLPYDPQMKTFVQASFPPRATVLGGALDLVHRIHAEFRFDAKATTLTTPVARILEDRRGVCQDFAHVAISGLRALGLAARYVSGYLLTDPPPGQPRLLGADASHAWISVYCPPLGWIDLDPTNDVIVGTRHVTLAWGRDYGDVSPLRGVLLGGAEHTLSVGVSVVPLDDADACA